MLDVDNFKKRNDTYGHDNGDLVLRQVAKCIRDSLREGDFAARYGGEEFVVLLPECSEPDALMMCDRILKCIRSEHWHGEPVTVSIGAVSLDEATPSQSGLVTLADEALYAAKRAGKDCAVGYRSHFEQMADLKGP
jgi:diguanylate cyclase (GGDEF)-like protein